LDDLAAPYLGPGVGELARGERGTMAALLVPALSSVLATGPSSARGLAASRLALLGGLAAPALGELTRAAHGPGPQVGRAARVAVRVVRGAGPRDHTGWIVVGIVAGAVALLGYALWDTSQGRITRLCLRRDLQGQEAAPALVRALDDGNEDVRRVAA